MRAASYPHRKRHPRSFSTRNSTELWQCLETTNERVNNMSKGMTLTDAVHAHSRAPRVELIEALDSTGSLREDGMSTAYNLHAVLARPNSRKDVKRLQSSSGSRPKVVRPPSLNAGGGRLGDELVTSFGDKSLSRMTSQYVMSRTGVTAASRRDDGETTQCYSTPAAEQVAEMFEDVRNTPQKQDWLSAKSSISAAQAWGLRSGSSGGSRGDGARPATSSLSRSDSLPTASVSTQSRKKKTTTPTRGSIGFRAETPEQKLLAKRMAYGSQRPRTSGTPYRALPKGTSIELRHHGYVQFMRDINKSDVEADIEEALAVGHNEETTAAQRIEHNLRKMEMRRAGHDALEEVSIMSPNARKLSSIRSGIDPHMLGSPVSPPGSPMSASLPVEMSALFGPDQHNTKEVKHIEFHFNDLPEARLHYGTLVALEVRSDIFITMERPSIPGQHGKFVAKHSRHRTPRDEWVFRVMDLMNPESSRPVCWDDAIWLKAGGEAMKHAKETPLIVLMGAKLVQPQTLPVVNIDSSVLEGFKQRESELEKCGEPIALHTPLQKGRVQNRKNTAKGDNIGKWKIRSINPALRHAPVPKRLKDASRAKKTNPSPGADPELENIGSAKEQHILNFNEVYFEQDFFYLANEIPQGGDVGELFLKPYNKEELHGETPDRPAIVTLRIVLEASSASSSKDQKKAFAVTSEATTLLSQSILNRNGGRKYIAKSADQNETNITGGAKFTTELRQEIANAVARNEHESLIPHMEKEQSIKHLVVAQHASNLNPNTGLPFHSGFDGISYLDGGGSTLSSLEEHHFIIGGASSLASAGNMAGSTDAKMKSGATVQLADGHATEGDPSDLDEPKRASILDRINDRMKFMNTEDGLIQILAAEANMVMEQEAAEEAKTAAKAAAGDKWAIIKQKMGKDPHSPTAKFKTFGMGGHRATAYGSIDGRGSGRSGGTGTFHFGSNVKNLISLLKKEKNKNMDEAIEDALKKHFSVNTLRGEMKMEDQRTQSYISYKDHKIEMEEIMAMIKTLSGATAAEGEVDIRLARKNRQMLEKQKQKEELSRLSLADGKCIDISLAMSTFGNDKSLLSTMVASVCNAYVSIWEPALSKCLRNLEFKRFLTVLGILDVASDTFAGTGLRERTLDVIDLVTDASEHALHTLAERNEVREAIIEKLEAMHEMMVSLAYLPVSLAPPSPAKKKSAVEEGNPGVLPLITGQHVPGWRSFFKQTNE